MGGSMTAVTSTVLTSIPQHHSQTKFSGTGGPLWLFAAGLVSRLTELEAKGNNRQGHLGPALKHWPSLLRYPTGHLLADGYRDDKVSLLHPNTVSYWEFPMGPGHIGSAAVVVANIALAATLSTTVDAAYPVTEFTDLVFATSNPIRTVVTVNSNRVDVLAADEQDVPKVIEKLRELCAGPFAPLYPEICEHFEGGGTGEDLDLNGFDPIIWWPPEETTPQLITATSTKADETTSEPPSPILSSLTLAEKTGSAAEAKEKVSITTSNVIPSHTLNTSSPLHVTLTVPAEIKTTKTLKIVVHELSGTGPSTSPTSVVRGESLDKNQTRDPTTFETKIKSGSANPHGESASSITAEPTLREKSNTRIGIPSTLDEFETPPRVPTSTVNSEVTFWPPSPHGTSKQPTTARISNNADSHVSRIAILTLSAPKRPNTITDRPPEPQTSSEPQTSLDCPWKTDEDDEGPGPCTVITIWHTSVIHFGPTTSSRTPEFRPVFEPTASPRPSRTWTSFDIPLAEPPTITDEPIATPIWFTGFHGCTQTLKILRKMAANPLTATVYASTVTSTAFVSCSCPNLATEYIGGYGLAILPRTTTTIDATHHD